MNQNITTKKNRFILIFFLTLALFIKTPDVLGDSNSSNWVDQPDWAAEPSGSSEGRSVKKYSRESYRKVIPFSPDSHNIGLEVGQIFLMGDVGEGFSDSIGGRLNYHYGVSDIFGFNASIGHASHEGKGNLNIGSRYSMTYLSAGMRANLAWFDKVIPYAVVGLGFYRPSYRFAEANSTVSPVVFGLNLGPGVSLELTDHLFFGVSLTFHDLFGTTKQSIRGPLEVGGTFSTFFLTAGATF